MGGSSGGGTSTTRNEIPKELKGLYKQTGTSIRGFQDTAPITPFAASRPMNVAPLSGTQRQSLTRLNEALDYGDLEDAPIIGAAERLFEKSIAPNIINRATVSGLGRGTALTNALASAQAEAFLPLLQGEQERRDRLIGMGFEGGQVERAAEQDVFSSEYQDFLRRQGLSEQALFGPMGNIPSSFGQTTKTTTSGGGGLFK